jgi:hypothetical protein
MAFFLQSLYARFHNFTQGFIPTLYPYTTVGHKFIMKLHS